MATLREVRRRIGGVRKTQKITRAMKMVAAAKLRRRQAAVIAARPYARKMKELLAHLSGIPEAASSDLMTPREIKSIALIVVTSDRGFCGAFNANLLKAAVAHAEAQPDETGTGKALKIFSIGKKGTDFFTKRQYNIASRRVGLFARLDFTAAKEIAGEVTEGYLRGEYDRVDIVYNEFKTVAQQRIVIEQYLPIPQSDTGRRGGPAAEYIYEPGRHEILLSLIPRHLNFQLWRVLLESNAAEEGARMAAMENATENARELITSLQLQYNKARQASITKELLEVVAGAEALSAGE
ncbi:MAG: ATP synthase F1 subunit gamma [Bacteroidota bacterium]